MAEDLLQWCFSLNVGFFCIIHFFIFLVKIEGWWKTMRASRGEIKIEEILKEAGLRFTEEFSFEDLLSETGRPLRFDFAVWDDNDDIDFLIEF